MHVAPRAEICFNSEARLAEGKRSNYAAALIRFDYAVGLAHATFAPPLFTRSISTRIFASFRRQKHARADVERARVTLFPYRGFSERRCQLATDHLDRDLDPHRCIN